MCNTPSCQGQTHFHPKGKLPSQYTVQAQQHQRQILPLSDLRDFDEARHGFIAAPDYRMIKNDKGSVAWDLGRYDFLLQGRDFDSIHPSLQRQAILNMSFGLYEVTPGIYQVRGYDLAVISFIKGKTGWIIIDPLTVKETSRAALKFVNEKLGARPVVAVIISHSHADHFGGIRGVVNDADLKAGKVQILAPKGFMQEAISENLYAGPAMMRRKVYTYGDALPANPFGHVDMAIGKSVAVGDVGILPPTRIIMEPIEELEIDGVHMVFQNTPGTEAPAEMNTWFPDFNALWLAENVVAGLHNVLTLRGAPVRDTLAWAKYINIALYEWGDTAKVLFQSHSWPRWGTERIQEVLRGERDMYANLNNQVLNLANNGITINEVHNIYEPPPSLQNQWFARGYHGTFEHNSRAVIQRYLGFWDCNPATLIPLSPKDSAPLYVEMMGGADKIMPKGQELYDQNKYREAQEILNKLVYAEPQNQPAKDLLADVWEQLGYQAEGAGLRNIYLVGAKELRDGIIPVAAAKTTSPDFVRGTTTEMFLNYLGIQVDTKKAVGLQFKINLVTPDNGEKFVIEMSNATLTTIAGYIALDADLIITFDRAELEDVMIGAAKLVDKVKDGKAKMEGKIQVSRMMKFNTTKSLFVAMAFLLMCLWTFNTVHSDDANVALTKEAQAAITPAKALEMLKQGNKRFVSNELKKRDILAQVKQTSKGQFPFAAIVSCLDSRIAPELVFDQGIGDIFVASVAGNFVNDDILGSLEFATKLAGSKLIVVMGHTDCGAVQGACDKAQLGLLTATLANINPAVNAVRGEYTPRTSKNDKFVQAVTEMNVKLTMQKLRDRSVVLREMIDKGEIGLVGAMYDVSTGMVTFYEEATTRQP